MIFLELRQERGQILGVNLRGSPKYTMGSRFGTI